MQIAICEPYLASPSVRQYMWIGIVAIDLYYKTYPRYPASHARLCTFTPESLNPKPHAYSKP